MSEPHITRLQPLRPRGLRLLVHLDRGEPFEVMLEAIERSRLGVGDALPARTRHHLLNLDADVRIRDAALNLISYRARTRIELVRRLRQKGFEAARIGPCLDRLAERGLIDDRSVAEAFVRDRLLHRPRGRARLSSELAAKGVDRDTAREAIEAVFAAAETDDTAIASDVVDGWMRRQSPATIAALAAEKRTPEREKIWRRLRGFLERRGFRGPALRAATERAVASARAAARD